MASVASQRMDQMQDPELPRPAAISFFGIGKYLESIYPLYDYAQPSVN